MRIDRSAVILYGSTNKKIKNTKLLEYKNKRYVELTKELVSEYEEILVADKDMYKSIDNEEEKIIRCIYDMVCKAKSDKVFVISSNMPLINKRLVNYMGIIQFEEDILIPYVDESLQSLCAIYNKSILKKLKYIIDNEEISFENLFKSISIRYIFLKDKSMFIGVDEIEEYITCL
ncbi:molybdenum cofactor guanylyltransferase [Clostridium sp. DSM 8431]|uniref:hypothetical protein n=1 Tax=Clostridium sp. DSM 8431 TaxID=1761781 RepID=UPI0008E6EC3B|nr:hypothetical protein [Clostridium sp. DSM 8431]SFU76853.1 molybdenum cofactor guanylyltransferase [Clostridium sp. DSM 8431]